MAAYEAIPGVLVLGLGHKARHGKDTAAQAMLSARPADVLRVGFADALYDYCRVEHGMTTKDAPLLQRVGVEMRQRNPQTWINAVYWKLLDKRPKIAVIPDVRFLNEAMFIHSMGGVTIKVERRNEDDTLFRADDRDWNHVSEIQLDGYSWDLTITNRTGQLGTLHANAIKAMNYFKEAHNG
jgi:hypothetical protein